MKTRATFTEISILILNPLNGWDVDVPDELYEEYMRALRQFNCIRVKLGTALTPQAEAFDKKMNQWHDRNGLDVIEGGKGK
jgi:hypothetical protein